MEFTDGDLTSVCEKATATVAANAFDLEDGSGLKWRPEQELGPQVALGVVDSRNALSGAGSDALRFWRL